MAGPWPVSGAAIAIGCRALRDDAWAEATSARLARDCVRLDGMVQSQGWTLVGGTPLFRLYETPDALAAQERLARAPDLVAGVRARAGMAASRVCPAANPNGRVCAEALSALARAGHRRRDALRCDRRAHRARSRPWRDRARSPAGMPSFAKKRPAEIVRREHAVQIAALHAAVARDRAFRFAVQHREGPRAIRPVGPADVDFVGLDRLLRRRMHGRDARQRFSAVMTVVDIQQVRDPACRRRGPRSRRDR